MARTLAPETPMACPEPGCGGTLRRRTTRFGLFYGCDRWKHTGCRGGIGCHPNGAPLGIPATRDVKAARIRAHEVFDRLWKGPGAPMRRGQAYRWLADALGLTEVHMAELDAEGCQRVIDAVNARKGPSTSVVGIDFGHAATTAVQAFERGPDGAVRLVRQVRRG